MYRAGRLLPTTNTLFLGWSANSVTLHFASQSFFFKTIGLTLLMHAMLSTDNLLAHDGDSTELDLGSHA